MNKSKQVRSLVFFFLLTVLILGCMQYVLRLSPSLIDIDLLDTRAFWARKEMLKLFTTIHEKGGKQAVRNLRLFYFLDLVFPLGYAGLLSLFFSTQLKLMVNTKAPKPLARKCIPAMFVIGGFFDVCENSFIIRGIGVFLRLEEKAKLPLSPIDVDEFMTKKVGMLGGILTMMKWNFLLALPLLIYVREIVLNPREDEEKFVEEVNAEDKKSN